MQGGIEVEEVRMDTQAEGLIPEEQGTDQDEQTDTEQVAKKEIEVLLRHVAAVKLGRHALASGSNSLGRRFSLCDLLRDPLS